MKNNDLQQNMTAWVKNVLLQIIVLETESIYNYIVMKFYLFFMISTYKWAALCETCFWVYADGKGPDQPAHPLSANRTLDTIECINGGQMLGWDFAHAQYKSDNVHFAHVRRHIFAWLGPYDFYIVLRCTYLLSKEGSILFHKQVITFQFSLISLSCSVVGVVRVVRRCCVSYITGASNWYWLTVGQGLLSL